MKIDASWIRNITWSRWWPTDTDRVCMSIESQVRS